VVYVLKFAGVKKMGKIEPFKKEKLVVGVIINEEKEEITVVKDTLIYSKKGWRALPWTYPDFQTVEYQVVLSEVRALYWQQIQAYVAITQVTQ